MKFKTLMTTFCLASAFFIGVSEAKQPPEYYQFEIMEAEKQGNFQRVIELLNKMIKEYKGDFLGIQGKVHLFDIYQGKCKRGFSGHLYDHPREMCQLLVNLSKGERLLEDIVAETEALLNSSEGAHHLRKKELRSLLIYAARTLESVYRNGFEEANIEVNPRKAEKYLKIKEKYEKLEYGQ
ncbi:hypothetical protein GVX81_04355 [[Haemophilus] felis]|uniref:Uncharacterized protein n=1 Tax=[Haemophilus] felis TaxID=123822 RepID=A0A1T0AZV7_9PAST|nr:hypothetical protein [[Haemophilus] felis]NBI40648.1 hypothetical protein [[Haemophilus] felis]OOS03209.1 hypothetical protein B0188_06820 [[Haemophilus] felis]